MGLGLKFPGGVSLGDMERAAPLRDLLGLRDLRCGVAAPSFTGNVVQVLQTQAVSTAAVGPGADLLNRCTWSTQELEDVRRPSSGIHG